MELNTKPIDVINQEQTQPRKQVKFSNRGMAAGIGLGVIVLLGAFLRFYELGEYSIGNTYYAATVQSMLLSWKNFFFAAFEPGGSVSVDKPPLGFWVQAVSAYMFGVNGFALALPQALAGTLSIPLLYSLVKRPFGEWAGLIAALALAITPVTISTERNNTIDGLLVFVLLLAAWAVIQSVRSGKFRYLLLSVFLVGLGFNIKMLQAFMVLPAFYALYFLGAPHKWWKRTGHLAVATVLLLAVSLSWAVAVDLTPAEDRPYVGSSDDNTVMELIVGHNGLSRLGLNNLLASDDDGPGGDDGGQPGQPLDGQPGQFAGNQPPPNDGQQKPGQIQGSPPQSPGDGPQSGQPPGGGDGQDGGDGGGGQFSHEVGQAGALRLFTEPLSDEASWLLPLALLSIPLLLVVLGWRWPLSEKHLAVVLWAGWLIPCVLYFTCTTGLFHAYYLIMLGPAMAALVGASAWALGKLWEKRTWLGWAAAALLAGGTLAFQLVMLSGYPEYAGWLAAISIALLVAGLGTLAWTAIQPRKWLSQAALGVTLLAVMVAPLAWSGLTTFNTNANVSLPNSGPDTGQDAGKSWSTLITTDQQIILDYLLANTDPDSYLVATLNAREAAPYILESLRPVLTFGGFGGSDNVVDVEQLAQMVASGELRFILGSIQQKPDIAAWIQNSCSQVNLPGLTQTASTNQQFNPGPGGQDQSSVLYDCGGSW